MYDNPTYEAYPEDNPDAEIDAAFQIGDEDLEYSDDGVGTDAGHGVDDPEGIDAPDHVDAAVIDVSPVEEPVDDVEPATTEGDDIVTDEDEEEEEELDLHEYTPVGDVVDGEQAGALPLKQSSPNGSRRYMLYFIQKDWYITIDIGFCQ